MRLEVDPAALRVAADGLERAAELADHARTRVVDVGPSTTWAPDLNVEGALDRALLSLEQWHTTAAAACREVGTTLASAAAGYEATEAALSGRDRRPE